MKLKSFLCLGLAILIPGCVRQSKPTVSSRDAGDPYYYLIRSNLEAYEGNVASSIEDLEKALKVHPDNIYLRYMAAERYAEAKQFDQAGKNLEMVLKSKPDWVDAKFLWARILEARGDTVKAGILFQEMIKIRPEDEENYLRLAQSLVDQKKYRQAEELLQGWVKKRPDSMAGYFYIATIQANFLNNATQALQTYRKILAIDPENIRVLGQVANIYMGQKKMKEALQEFLKIEAIAPEDLGIQLQIASIYYDMEKFVEAETRLENVVKTNPGADRIHYYLGLIYEKEGRKADALRHFSQVPSASTNYKEAKLHEASMDHDLKDFPAAVRVMKEAIRKDPKTPEFYQFLAILHEEEGSLEKAADVLEKGAKQLPDSEPIWFNLGILYDKLNKSDLAIGVMQKVLKFNPANSAALNYIGYTYADEGVRLDEAEALVEQALKIKPGDGYILDSMAWVYYQKGNLKKATFYIQKAFQLLPKEAAINEHYGDILLKGSNKPEALKYFKRALEFAKNKEDKDPEEIKRLEGKVEQLSK
ncbi:MAG: tetratricopeptide repeat protein [Deltaproteobacteria bacterium]|nr:tetratricopeptide repeat protein [Deltaproteobacteria bacterium]